MSVEKKQQQTMAYYISQHGHLHVTRLQILPLCNLMQPFIVAMSNINSIIDFFAAVAYTAVSKIQVHMCVKVKTGKSTIFLNKTHYDCSFISLSPIFTIFSILVNNNIVNMSHDCGCHGNHFGSKLYVTIVTTILYH